MIVLISPEIDIPNETVALTRLFQEGLQYYHLRKPDKNYQEYCAYLDLIDSQYHDRIIVHHFHELIHRYALKGIHFQEQKRRDLGINLENYIQNLNLNNKTISSSFHEPDELTACTFKFDYHLLSPVFSSISKAGYQGRKFDVNTIDKTIIGMGGVTANNLTEFTALGFQGVGILGGIWQEANPVARFKAIQSYYDERV